ncbi:MULTISPECIES: ABC transporter permease subunit [unclassified Ensifer]|uniref:ABC transporter permease n=1 Tax=unclassified Ensifer TaxID=2633371 RepID=UPI000813BA46|nr:MULTISPECIES: ABC transporter permease subunit [unclassified Ensifer]OCO99217.1 ABC transporter permease [Ensifer sp. LC11]OCO99425.1 ABC transporter permease [Ensifer sp. LC13]OCP14425.1 ABC transporter permease [Ensifer sp. LC14]OCP29537.1 ABC transporter permease [Ensifer sp. LC499]
MSDAIRDAIPLESGLAALPRRIWRDGVLAAAGWFAAAGITYLLPDTIVWGDKTVLLALLLAAGGTILLLLALTARPGKTLEHYGPWLIVIGLWLAVWELATAKFGWLPKPFFSPPQGLLHVYVTDWDRLLICVAYTARLWGLGFFSGILVGFAAGVALGWSKRFAYWGMPVLKLIGPVPASAWIPCTFFIFPTTFHASIFLVALASGVPVAILTASGVGQVNRSFYDVARTLGAGPRYLVLKVAIPAALPNVFVGLFMGLYYSFAVLVVAEMLGAKFGLGWYLQFNTAYSAYANVYAALIVMALICAGLVRLLFVVRDRLLGWQKGIL